MNECPRVMTKEQMIAGLKAGGILCVDRRDAPELPELEAMEKEGLVQSNLVIIDEQSSVKKFRWKNQDEVAREGQIKFTVKGTTDEGVVVGQLPASKTPGLDEDTDKS